MEYGGVVLSGTPGAGKSELARRLSAHYGWKKLSLGDYWKTTYRKTHPRGEVDFATFWRDTPREANIRINRNARFLLEGGGMICDSRYTAAYCQDLPLLLVYIDAPLDVRARRLVGGTIYYGQKIECIRKTLETREEDEVVRGKEFFGEAYDYRDARWYDLILDSNQYSIEEEMKILREHTSCGVVLPRAYGNLSLA